MEGVVVEVFGQFLVGPSAHFRIPPNISKNGPFNHAHVATPIEHGGACGHP